MDEVVLEMVKDEAAGAQTGDVTAHNMTRTERLRTKTQRSWTLGPPHLVKKGSLPFQGISTLTVCRCVPSECNMW